MQVYSGPKFYVQMGYQDQTEAETLLKEGITSGIIASPWHLNAGKLEEYLEKYRRFGAEIYIDPQFYNPKFINPKKGYSFYKGKVETEILESEKELNEIITGYLNYQISQSVSSLLIPVESINQLTKTWYQRTKKILKITKKWMKDNFPDIDVWGIWREPEDIVESIIRNGFYGKWYPEGVKEVTPTIRNEPELKKHYENLLGQVNNEIRNTAFLLAARTHFFLKYLDKDKLIIYEKFKKDPNHLLKFTRYYGLSDSDFSDMAAKDLNITGKMTKTKQADMFEQADKEFMDKIFEPIKKLKKTRFDD
ncbi:MAG: hypothetical protein ACOCWG_00395 [bacterium]